MTTPTLDEKITIWQAMSRSDDPSTQETFKSCAYMMMSVIRELKAEHEACCKLVIVAGLVTGHADTPTQLMREVLIQYGELKAERDALKQHKDKFIAQVLPALQDATTELFDMDFTEDDSVGQKINHIRHAVISYKFAEAQIREGEWTDQ